jgi:hypothetical protein
MKPCGALDRALEYRKKENNDNKFTDFWYQNLSLPGISYRPLWQKIIRGNIAIQ